MALTVGLRIGDDDFLRPEAECAVANGFTKGIFPKAPKINTGKDGVYEEEEGKLRKLEATKIQLADCLACSGCLTSAETILIESQGVEEFSKHLSTHDTVVTISSQARASLGTHFEMTQDQVTRKLCTLFLRLGVKYVFDANLGTELSLIETGIEFVERKRLSQSTNHPMLLGACPGWVCYAEKAHGDLLPNLITTKSPQQIMGGLIKTIFAKSRKMDPNRIYHVCIMSCYDKKLEASRAHSRNNNSLYSEVDCVLTSSEVLHLISSMNIDFQNLPETLSDRPLMNEMDQMSCSISGGTSGGYMEYVFAYAAKELYNLSDVNMTYKPGKNTDLLEVFLEVCCCCCSIEESVTDSAPTVCTNKLRKHHDHHHRHRHHHLPCCSLIMERQTSKFGKCFHN
eukprot:TRINITY_DN1904_c0_g1_i1.p1 TRINITY_DN1904_c0_g1~~TRINITY_DN1904_c0_g1_i1.p1  ORF type:complete len:398 (+),score=43.77 TRINITY_DN1904_c0_g1_i1:94-1287(+)